MGYWGWGGVVCGSGACGVYGRCGNTITCAHPLLLWLPSTGTRCVCRDKEDELGLAFAQRFKVIVRNMDEIVGDDYPLADDL